MKLVRPPIEKQQAAHKRFALIERLQEDSLFDGISTAEQLQDRLANSVPFAPPLIYPVDSRTDSVAMQTVLNDARDEIRASLSLSSEFLANSKEAQSHLFENISSIARRLQAVSSEARVVALQDVLSAASRGDNILHRFVPLWGSPEERIDPTVPDCYTTLNGFQTLAIKESMKHVVSTVEFSRIAMDEADKEYIEGPARFAITSSIPSFKQEVTVNLEHEEIINHIEIPLLTPSPIYLERILIKDSKGNTTLSFDRDDLAVYLNANPLMLELFFPPVECSSVHLLFQKVNGRKIGITLPHQSSLSERNIALKSSQLMKAMANRGYSNDEFIQSLYSDAYDFSVTGGIDATYYVTPTICVLNCRLTMFHEESEFSTLVYEGTNVEGVRNVVKGRNMLPTGLIDLVNITDIPHTAVRTEIIKTFTKERRLLRRVHAHAPIAGPFLGSHIEFLNKGGRKTQRSGAFFATEQYSTTFEPGTEVEQIKCYIPEQDAVTSIGFSIDIDSSRLTGDVSGNFLFQDILIKYPLKSYCSKSDAKVTGAKPWFINSQGTLMFRDDLENEDCRLWCRNVLQRSQASPFLTPLLTQQMLVLIKAGEDA